MIEIGGVTNRGILLEMRDDFVQALRRNRAAFGIDLPPDKIERLADYYGAVMEHNPLLHLVGPCSAAEFAVRHVLESLAMLEFLPEGARFADVGAGAGLPSIPCLIARVDLKGFLIESKVRKAGFLQTAIAKCELQSRATVINKQFAETPRPDVSYLSCRALDRFAQHLPKLLKWSHDCTLLFYGGPALREEMLRHGLKVKEKLLPMSEQRFLFVAKR